MISTSADSVGFLEFHQMDVLVEAGRAAARALLERCDGDLGALGQTPEVALGADHRHDESAYAVPALS